MLEPFLKWPGGKKWLVTRYSRFFPNHYSRFVEPFLGGGAVFFYLAPRRATLSDTNGELVNAYTILKREFRRVHEALRQLQRRHSKALYYRIRDEKPTRQFERAVRFLYLNRTCFNGIYRVNLKGDFNVPIGTKTLVEYPEDYLSQVAEYLQRACLRVCDFEEALESTRKGDFVFADPPYTVMHNNNNFVKYNAALFSWSDQIRLAAAIKRAGTRGVKIMLSNADHPSIRDLYSDFGEHYRVERSSILSADSSHRRQTTELLVVNYSSS